jgi:hypothetical protein
MPDFSGPIVIDTSRDLTVAWTGGQAGARALVQVRSDVGTDAGKNILVARCAYDPIAGEATVPAAALMPLAAGVHAELGIGQVVTTTFTASTWSIDLRAFTIHSEAVTLQ